MEEVGVPQTIWSNVSLTEYCMPKLQPQAHVETVIEVDPVQGSLAFHYCDKMPEKIGLQEDILVWAQI